MPAGRAGFDGQVHDARFGKFRADFLDERLAVGEDLLRCFAGGEIIVPGVKDDGFGLIRDDDAVGKKCGIGKVRTAESAIDDFQIGKNPARAFSKSESWNCRRKDGVPRRGLVRSPGLESLDLRLELRWVMGGLGRDEEHRNFNEKGRQNGGAEPSKGA